MALKTPNTHGHWWESLLHNRRARRIAQQLMMVHGVQITLVPWMLDSSELIYGRRSRPLPGDDRAGRITSYGLIAAHRHFSRRMGKTSARRSVANHLPEEAVA